MSKETEDALDEAIKAHYKDECTGGFMTDYYVTIAGVPGDGTNSVEYIGVKSDSPLHTIYGVAKIGMKQLEAHIEDILWGGDDDDE